MNIGDTLYLINHTHCKIITGIYEGLNPSLEYHKILFRNKQRQQVLLFKRFEINPIINAENFWHRILNSYNVGNNTYFVFDNEKQALEVFKHFVVPIHIKSKTDICDSYREKYMNVVEEIAELEKLLICNAVPNLIV